MNISVLVLKKQKKSNHVKRQLGCVYTEHGVPERLHSDNGGEVQNQVKNFCEKNKIKMIQSRPYNP